MDPFTALATWVYSHLVSTGTMIATCLIIWSILSAGINLARGLASLGIALVAAYMITHADQITAALKGI